VVELEEACDTFGVDVVRDGGTTEFDGVLQHFEEGGAEAGELVAGEASGLVAWTYAGVEERLVGVDVAHTMEERLVEECGLDGCLAVTEERDEVFERDGEGLTPGAGVGVGGYGETAEAARIDEAKLFASAQREDGMGMRRDLSFRGRDEEAAGHSQVDQKLCGNVCRRLFSKGADYVGHDGLPDAVNAFDAGAGEYLRDLGGGRLERLGFVAGPDRENGLSVDELVDAVGDGFDFRKLGHGVALSIGVGGSRKFG